MNDPLMIGSLSILEIRERISHLTELLLEAERELNYCRSDINCPTSVIEDVQTWIAELESARREYHKALN